MQIKCVKCAAEPKEEYAELVSGLGLLDSDCFLRYTCPLCGPEGLLRLHVTWYLKNVSASHINMSMLNGKG